MVQVDGQTRFFLPNGGGCTCGKRKKRQAQSRFQHPPGKANSLLPAFPGSSLVGITMIVAAAATTMVTPTASTTETTSTRAVTTRAVTTRAVTTREITTRAVTAREVLAVVAVSATTV